MPQPNPPESYRKSCTLCNKPRDVLVRCQIDPNTPIPAPTPSTSTTSPSNPDSLDPNSTPTTTTPPLKPGAWHFVCPGSCWQRVSGGVIDGDLAEGRQGYRYGGMWKNKHAGASAKVPRRLKGKLGRDGGKGVGGAGAGGGEGRGEYGRKEDGRSGVVDAEEEEEEG